MPAAADYPEMMSGQAQDQLDLAKLALLPGQARSLPVALDLTPFAIGGQSYAPAERPVEGVLDVSKTLSGHALRLRFAVTVAGPCARCLEPTRIEVSIDSREVDQHDEPDDELTSPYVEAEILQVGHWASDALVLATPDVPVCSEDCGGLCAECGKRLVEGEEHGHGRKGDPRLSKLGEIRLD